MKPEMSKAEKARRAKKRKSKTFRHYCEKCGAMREHRVSDTKCVTCERQRDKGRAEALRQDPEARERRNDASRQRYHAAPGKSREYFAAVEWRKATKADRMHAWHEDEREAMQAVYAGLIEVQRFKDFKEEVDHLTPKRAKVRIDGKVQVVATGLHTFANIGPLPKSVNREKRSYFNPELERNQRPANRHPGGAFDPEPTPKELEHMRRMSEEFGVSTEENAEGLRNLKVSLDQQARAYENHVGKTFDIEILVDPAWIECRGLTERKPLEPLRGLGFKEEPDEETVRAFAALLSHEILQMQSEEVTK